MICFSFDRLPLESGSEDKKEMVAKLSRNPDESGSDCAEGASASQPALGVSEEKTSEEANEFCFETSVVSGMTENEVSKIFDSSNVVEEGVSHLLILSSSGDKETSNAEVNGNCISKAGIQEEVVTTNSEKPLNLQEFNSAPELEVLGMERLKSELQAQGLKCGGTLQESAARLFLLKTTPLEMLPKKLLANK